MEQIISVITICYNSELSIERTIKSVLSQTYPNIEYIIIDGKSSDGTNTIIQKYQDNISKYISEEDSGIYNAMNKGLTMAIGEWVCFMNAGDVFVDNQTVERVFFTPIKNNVDVIYGYTFCNNKRRERKDFQMKQRLVFALMPKRKSFSMGFCHQSTFVRTALAKSIGFDEKYKIAADYNMIYTIYKQGKTFYNSNTDISIFDNTGISSLKSIPLLKEVANIIREEDSILFYKEYVKILVKYIGRKLIYILR